MMRLDMAGGGRNKRAHSLPMLMLIRSGSVLLLLALKLRRNEMSVNI